MEQRSASEIIDQFLPIIRRYENDARLVLLEATEEPGAQIGENYLSVMRRTKIKGLRGNGTTYEKSFMRKCLLENEHLAKVSRNTVLFQKEAHFYKNILPKLGSIGPDCIYTQNNEIIMEDLGKRNFSICKSSSFLDLEHCLAVIRTLALMHSSSLKLEMEDPKKFAQLIDPLKETVFPEDDIANSIGSYCEKGLQHVLDTLNKIQSKNDELENAIKYFSMYQGNVFNIMKNLLNSKADKYCVITHGDAWNNNILFLHDENGNVVDVKLVDFQLVRHCSPAIDFTYFVYSSAKLEVIENNFQDLMDHYQISLTNNLKKLGVSLEHIKALDLDWLKRELRNSGLFGFILSLLVIHVVFMEKGQAVELEIQKNEEKEDEIVSGTVDYDMSPEKTDRIRRIVEHFVEHVVNL